MGYCDPDNGLPPGMPEDFRNNIQAQAEARRTEDLEWLNQPIESKAVRRSKVKPKARFRPTLGDLLRIKDAA